MKDRLTVSLRAMTFTARVGTLPHEHEIPQPIEVDLSVVCDPRILDVQEGLAPGFIDYRALYSLVESCLESRHHELIEDVARIVTSQVLLMDGVQSARIAIRKTRVALPGPLAAAEVILERSNDS